MAVLTHYVNNNGGESLLTATSSDPASPLQSRDFWILIALAALVFVASLRRGAGHDEEAMLVEERLDVTGHCVAHIRRSAQCRRPAAIPFMIIWAHRPVPGPGEGVLGWVPCSRSVVSLDPYRTETGSRHDADPALSGNRPGDWRGD